MQKTAKRTERARRTDPKQAPERPARVLGMRAVARIARLGTKRLGLSREHDARACLL